MAALPDGIRIVVITRFCYIIAWYSAPYVCTMKQWVSAVMHLLLLVRSPTRPFNMDPHTGMFPIKPFQIHNLSLPLSVCLSFSLTHTHRPVQQCVCLWATTPLALWSFSFWVFKWNLQSLSLYSPFFILTLNLHLLNYTLLNPVYSALLLFPQHLQSFVCFDSLAVLQILGLRAALRHLPPAGFTGSHHHALHAVTAWGTPTIPPTATKRPLLPPRDRATGDEVWGVGGGVTREIET